MAALRDRIEACLREERFAQARVLVEEAGADPALVLPAAELRALEGSPHEALLLLEGAIDTDALVATDRLEASARAIELCGRLGARVRFQAAVARARDLFGDSLGPRLDAAEARGLLGLDDREAARALLERAPTSGPGAGDLALERARLALVEGDFERAEANLLACDPKRERPAALRLRADVDAARGDFAGEVSALRELLRVLPESDRRPTDWLNLGFALAAAGQREAARTEFAALATAHPEHRSGRYAQSRADHLARGADAPRRVLAVPSVHQRRDYCGPAALEICFRYFGVEATQDRIAGAIKRETGTPTSEMVTFLDREGLRARRIVATAERLRRCIDLGLPVILEEEYATTFHVAVVIGYDAALDLLIVQDPMRHRHSTRPMGWAESGGRLVGNGAIVVLGRKENAEAALAALDEAGIVEAAHLRILDRASRRTRGLLDEGTFEDASPREVLRLADLALELEPTYRLAWLRRLHAKLALSRQGQAHLADDLVRDLYQAVSHYGDEEWPHQFHGRFHFVHDRMGEAFAAYLEAHRCDPDDGNNLAYLADCKLQMGYLADAERFALGALENAADDGAAEWILASVYLRAVVALDDADEERTEEVAARRHPLKIAQPLERDRTALLRRARFFADLAVESDRTSAYHSETAGLIALREERFEEARVLFERALEHAPSRVTSSLGRASALEALGSFDDAEPLLVRLKEANVAGAHLALADYYARRDRPEDRMATLVEALDVAQGRKRPFVERLWAALTSAADEAEAAQRLVLALKNVTDENAIFFAGDLLNELDDCDGPAIEVLRQGTCLSPDREIPHYLTLLADLLSKSVVTREEALGLYARARDGCLCGYTMSGFALATAASDVEAALEMVAPFVETYAFAAEASSTILAAAGRAKESARAARRALAAHDDPPIQAAQNFANWHRTSFRYDRAVHWAGWLIARPAKEWRALDDDVAETVRTCIAEAFVTARRGRELVPWLDRLLPEERKALAWPLYRAATDGPVDHSVALEAALRLVEDWADNDDASFLWTANATHHQARLGDEASARSFLREVERRASAIGWTAASEFHRMEGAVPEALAAARRAVELDPTSEDALDRLCLAAVAAGAPEDALEPARARIRVAPHLGVCWEFLALLLARLGGSDAEALDASERAVAIGPHSELAHAARAAALLRTARLDEAGAHARQAMIVGARRDEEGEVGVVVAHAVAQNLAALDLALQNPPREESASAFPDFHAHLRLVAARS